MVRTTQALTRGVALGAAALVLLQTPALPRRHMQPVAPLSTGAVVARMVAMNAARTRALHAFSAWGSYHVAYQGVGHATAAMTVRVEFQQPGPKRFTIVAESGSAMLRHHVLEPLVAAERRDAVRTRDDGSAIVPANYKFRLLSAPAGNDDGSYVLEATPRTKRNRFLFRGTIWLNARDFGIERIQGTLPHSPSFWVTGATFDYHSQKIGAFWLPARNQTRAQVRFFGHATLEIRYHNFDLTSASPVGLPASAGDVP